MRSLAKLFIQLVAVIGGFCLCFFMIASLLAPPVSRTAPAPGPATLPPVDPTPVWTEQPVRIDQASRPTVQPLEDPFPYRFRAAANIQVHDGGSFSVPDGVMLLEDIVAPQPRAICTDTAGRKTACGARARAELRRLLAGKYIECRRNLLASRVWLANCRINGRSVSQAMLDRAEITGVRRVIKAP